jgi:hypothetical protein
MIEMQFTDFKVALCGIQLDSFDEENNLFESTRGYCKLLKYEIADSVNKLVSLIKTNLDAFALQK